MALGASSPASPALIRPEPLSITTPCTSSPSIYIKQMSSNTASLVQKVQRYSGQRSPKESFKASRSINPEFPHISKFDDVTRFNSANYNVYFYKDYPNRTGTPIKTEKRSKQGGFRRSLSPKKQQLMRLIHNGHETSGDFKQHILSHAMQAPLRTNTSPPRVNYVAPGPVGSTMNDFHKRETNPGYARNGSGGFYTR